MVEKWNVKEDWRGDEFSSKIATKIWQEEANENNPYLAENCRCHGYDLMEAMGKLDYVSFLFLILQGELPTKDQSELLSRLMIGFANPGPRHLATRGAMNAAVSRARASLILPLSMSLLSGSYLGGEEVENSMRFLRKNLKTDPDDVLKVLLQSEDLSGEGDHHIAPGFSSRFGGRDPMPQKIASALDDLEGNGKALGWGQRFAKELEPYSMGWVSTGVCAAVFCDLGFQPRVGPGLFQLVCAPGLLAHGCEMLNKPITAMPFLDSDHYIIDPAAKKHKSTTEDI